MAKIVASECDFHVFRSGGWRQRSHELIARAEDSQPGRTGQGQQQGSVMELGRALGMG